MGNIMSDAISGWFAEHGDFPENLDPYAGEPDGSADVDAEPPADWEGW